jgi:hypothetical protein
LEFRKSKVESCEYLSRRPEKTALGDLTGAIVEILIGLLLVIGLWVALSIWLDKRRRARLFAKYGDMQIVEGIMRRTFWQGQTPEQLVDSIGRPVDVDRKVMKNKTKEVWKYQQTGKGRFALRITFENDVVVGWEKKA